MENEKENVKNDIMFCHVCCDADIYYRSVQAAEDSSWKTSMKDHWSFDSLQSDQEIRQQQHCMELSLSTARIRYSERFYDSEVEQISI